MRSTMEIVIHTTCSCIEHPKARKDITCHLSQVILESSLLKIDISMHGFEIF